MNERNGFPGGSVSEECISTEGDLDLIPGLGRSPGKVNGRPLQNSCLEYSADRRTWRNSLWGNKGSDTTGLLTLQKECKGDKNRW